MRANTSNTLALRVVSECRKQRDRWFNKYCKPENWVPSVVINGEIQIPKEYKKEFSAAVAGCQDPDFNVEHVGCSGCDTTKWSEKMELAFDQKLGGSVGDHSPITGCTNRIGNCAEQHAANMVMNEHEEKGIHQEIENLAFTQAIRPRTMIEIDYCLNCRTLFEE